MKVKMFSPLVTEEAIERVCRTLRSGYLGEGPTVVEFEDTFKEILNVPYALAVTSGTTALHLALDVAGVRPGDEVITTAQTMMATSHAVLAHYARPVFTDIQYLTGNMDPDDIEHRITEKTKAILVVHWAGYPCDMEEIRAIASKHGLPVIEDAAHALGAEYREKPVGSLSSYTCFSFQAIKHITTGDGGMICFVEEDAYQQARRKRWYGIDRQNRKPSLLGEPVWNVTEVGYKYHMNDIAASLGVVHIRRLSSLLERRAQIVQSYRESLGSCPGIKLFEAKKDRKSANWLFSIHVEDRDNFARMMGDRGVEVSVVHLRIDGNSIFGPLREDLKTLDSFTKTHISLPLHNLLTDEDTEYVIQCIREGW
jgi:perosamine synthetase